MRLSVQIEFDKTLDLQTTKDRVIVGRDSRCDLMINHNSISREHCEIHIFEGQYFITDLGSSNGTKIDGQKLVPHQRTSISLGQQFKLGGLECEVSNTPLNKEEYKIISSTTGPKGSYTATIRLGRIELNKPSKTLELQKQLDRTTPLNPIVAEAQAQGAARKRINKLPLLFLLIFGALVFWLIFD